MSQSLLGFLSRFSVDFIRAYVFSTALPGSLKTTTTSDVVVSRFIRHLYDSQDSTFESVIILVKGQMYSNALICPDLESIQKTFKRVTFYFDTPVVLSALGFQTEVNAAATRELLNLIVRLKGAISVFSHTVSEIDTVLEFVESHIDHSRITSRGLGHFRDRKMKRGDIALFRGELDANLKKIGFEIKKTPDYVVEHQIAEADLEERLRSALNYRSARGAEYDANSVRSIFALRRGSVPRRLEDCSAVFVTDNSMFARIAFEHGKNQNSTREVSSVITDYCLANVAWLKAPLGAPDLPEKETIAACYAALEPSSPLWDRYLKELDALEKKRSMTADDLAVLRVSGLARNELMRLTVGDEKAFGADSVPQILSRVKASLVADQVEALNKVKKEKADLIDQKRAIERRATQARTKLYWASGLVSNILSSGLLTVLLIGIVAASLGSVNLTTPWANGSSLGTSLLNGAILGGTLWGIASAYFGLSLREMNRLCRNWMHQKTFKKLESWLLGDT